MRKIITLVLLTGLALVLGTAAQLGTIYNQLVGQEQAVRTGWGEVHNLYQKRYDLVGNLVATVKGSAAFERGTLREIIEARSKVGSLRVDSRDPGYQQAQDRLSGSFSHLLVVLERYPELRTTDQFRDLLGQLQNIEDEISVARHNLNEQVRAYDTQLRRWPDLMVARQVGLKPEPYFMMDNAAGTTPRVRF